MARVVGHGPAFSLSRTCSLLLMKGVLGNNWMERITYIHRVYAGRCHCQLRSTTSYNGLPALLTAMVENSSRRTLGEQSLGSVPFHVRSSEAITHRKNRSSDAIHRPLCFVLGAGEEDDAKRS